MMMMYQMSILEVKEAHSIMTMVMFYLLSMRTQIITFLTARTVNKRNIVLLRLSK
jgi:hypothetical protein